MGPRPCPRTQHPDTTMAEPSCPNPQPELDPCAPPWRHIGLCRLPCLSKEVWWHLIALFFSGGCWSQAGSTRGQDLPHSPPSSTASITAEGESCGIWAAGCGFAFESCPLPSAELAGIKRRLFLLGQKSLVGSKVPALSGSRCDPRNRAPEAAILNSKANRSEPQPLPMSHPARSSCCSQAAGGRMPGPGPPYPTGAHHSGGTEHPMGLSLGHPYNKHPK